jgi:hypothetical protein
MHTMTEGKKTNRIIMLDVAKDGSISERVAGVGQENWLDTTLLGTLYPGIHLALVSVPTEILEYAEGAAVSDRLMAIDHDGIRYRMVGASGSAKNGKFYFCDTQHAPVLADRFAKWPEAAITYFGILTSNCKVVISEPDVRVMVVPDNELGTNDCRGWISQSMFAKLRLRSGAFYQFRLAFGTTQAKGSFKVMGDDVADALDADIIVPESSVKPTPSNPSYLFTKLGLASRTQRGPIVLGIREVSKNWTFESSYTVLQNAPEAAIFTEIVPSARQMIHELAEAFRTQNHRKVVELIGKEVATGDSSDAAEMDVEYQRTIEAVLLADGTGELTQHPYVHSVISRLIARWAYKLLTGGSLYLPAFALADDGYLFLQDGKVVSGADWLPRNIAIVTSPINSSRGLCVRYPVRMKEDLLPMTHIGAAATAELLVKKQGFAAEVAQRLTKEQLCLDGTYTLHSKTAKRNGGDFDFDMVCVIDGNLYPQFVESRFSLTNEYTVEKTKAERNRSPWYNLEFVALKALGNQIGVITDLMSSALANNREDLLYELVPELQKEIDSLKHNVRADLSKLKQIRGQMKYQPEWLRLKEAKSLKELPAHLAIRDADGNDLAPIPDSDRIGKVYNALRKDLAEMTGKPLRLPQFAGLIVGNTPTEAMFQECRLLNKIWACGNGMLRSTLETEKHAVDAASKRLQHALAAPKQDEGLIGRLRKEHSKAKASYRMAEAAAKERASILRQIIAAWGQAKKTDRKAWCQALHTLVCKTKNEQATGSILFHAFPQEVVDAIAERTGGERTLVQPPTPRAAVVVKGNALYTFKNGETFYIFKYDEEARTIRK